MKIRAGQLKDKELDFWVAKALGYPVKWTSRGVQCLGLEHYAYHPSFHWDEGGPIIEDVGINLFKSQIESTEDTKWYAQLGEITLSGSTPLEAAMRVFVTYQLGEAFENNEY